MQWISLPRSLPLVIGIVLPVLFIAFVALFAYVPTLSIRPAHDFIYTPQGTYAYAQGYRYDYRVSEGRLERIDTGVPQAPDGSVSYPMPEKELYYYDIEAQTSRAITFEEAQRFALEPGPSSPDGYIVELQSGSGGFLFGGGSQSGYIVTKGGAGKRLDALQGYWGTTLEVIGWVR